MQALCKHCGGIKCHRYLNVDSEYLPTHQISYAIMYCYDMRSDLRLRCNVCPAHNTDLCESVQKILDSIKEEDK